MFLKQKKFEKSTIFENFENLKSPKRLQLFFGQIFWVPYVNTSRPFFYFTISPKIGGDPLGFWAKNGTFPIKINENVHNFF